ncbi:MAG: hypothetical protein AAB468_01695 [Patescibacteria group bacterium]
MIEIIPAVIGINFEAVREKIAIFNDQTNWLHLDVADGQFVPDTTWQSASDLETLNGQAKIEVHLMVRDPEEVVSNWTPVADRIIIHPEATSQCQEIIDAFTSQPVELGLAVLLDTPLSSLNNLLTAVKSVQLMSIAKLGHQGEPFADIVYERIKLLRQEHPNVKISVDGGVNLDNAGRLLAAGADRLVIGSAIWQNSDPTSALTEFQRLTYASTRR